MRLPLFISALTIIAAPLDAQPPRPVHGTYAVWICPKGCALRDTASAPVAGYVVLNSAPIPLDDLSAEMRKRSIFLITQEEATACFHLTKRRSEPSTMAGIIPSAATTWAQRGDTIEVALYASPDAHFVLTAVADGTRLTGRGRQSGFIIREFDDPAGDVHGVRIGPADFRRCDAPAR